MSLHTRLPPEWHPVWLGFLSFFPQTLWVSLGFHIVASLKQSPVVLKSWRLSSTWAANAMGHTCPRPASSAFRNSCHTCCFYTILCALVSSQFPLPCGLWTSPERPSQAAAILCSCLDHCSGFYSFCSSHTLSAHDYMPAAAAAFCQAVHCLGSPLRCAAQRQICWHN